MKIKTQMLINTVGNAGYLAALWLLTVITTNCLSYEAVGILTLTAALGNVFAIFQCFGVRYFQSSDMIFQYAPLDYLRARLITCGVGLLLGIAVSFALGYSLRSVATILLFLLLKSSESFSDVLFGDDQRAGHLEYAGYSMLLRGILISVLFFIGAYFLRRLNAALLLAAAGAWLLSLAMDIPIYRNTVDVSHRAASGGTMGVLRQCFPLVVAALLPTAVTAIPRVVLEKYYGPETLGFYGNVSAPALFLTAVTPSILAVFLPRYGRAFSEGRYRDILRTMGMTFLCCLLLGGVCMAGALVLGRWVLAIVYTEQILPYYHYLYPIILTMIVYSLDMCAASTLIAMRESKMLLLAAFIAFALCLICAVPLVRAYGIGGAIAALAIPYGVQAGVQTAYIVHHCKKKENTL